MSRTELEEQCGAEKLAIFGGAPSPSDSNLSVSRKVSRLSPALFRVPSRL